MMNSLEIDNVEKLLQELEETSQLLLVDDNSSPKQFHPQKNLEKVLTKPHKTETALRISYEFLSSLDLHDLQNLVIEKP